MNSKKQSELPPAPKKPDRSAFTTKLMKKREEIDKLKSRLSEIQDILTNNRTNPEIEKYYERQRELTQQLNDLRAQINSQRLEKSGITKAMSNARTVRQELESKVHTLTGELGAFKEIQDIHDALHHVEMKMETEGNGSLRQEKEFLKKKKLLEAAKEQLKSLDPIRVEIEEFSNKEWEYLSEAKKCHSQLVVLDQKLQQLYSAKAELQYPAHREQEEKAKLRAERETLRQKIAALFEDMDALRQSYSSEEDSYRKKYELWKANVEEIRKRQQEERLRKEQEAALKREVVNEIRRLNPFETEITLCNVLVAYLHDKLGTSATKIQRRQSQSGLPVLITGIDVADLLKPPVQEDWLFADRRKGKSRGPPPPTLLDRSNGDSSTKTKKDNRDVPVKIDIHRLLSFDQLDVRPPRFHSEIPAVIQKLQEKKQYYQEHTSRVVLTTLNVEDGDSDEDSMDNEKIIHPDTPPALDNNSMIEMLV
eukprot:PhF_6_TR44223/c2_g1_i2/m.67946